MEGQTLRSAVRRLRRVVAAPAAGPDAELLRAFTTRRDAGAFESIVRRHGPMVLGVCRRVLRDASDADDAFQATFLVLVRKAGSLRAPDRLAGWLHQVAHRVARKLRTLRLNRARLEGVLFDVPAGEPPAEVVWRELRPIFDAELDRLPDRLRLPAVLCLLEGQSKGEAARALGWPEGTVSCRLQRARERLRVRLAARGLTLSAGALAAAMFEGAGSAAVPDRLIESTIQSVSNPATAAGARALADGITQAMFLTKVKAVAATVLVVGVVGSGTGVALIPGAGPGQVAAVEPGGNGQTKEAAPAPRQVPLDDPRAIADRIHEARTKVVVADLETKHGHQKSEVALRELQRLLQLRVDALRTKAESWRPLLLKGTIARGEWDRLQADIKSAEEELKWFESSARAPVPADPERAVQQQELDLLKERLAFEERMVAKGYMTESQVKKTRLEISRAEANLAKKDTPKAADPRRQLLETTIQKLEQIVEQTRQSVKAGIAPQQELLNCEMTLANYKLKFLELDDRPAVASPHPSAERRAVVEAIIQKLEEIVAQTEDGVKKGMVSQQELLNAQIKVLEYKLKLAELSVRSAADPRAAKTPPEVFHEREVVIVTKEQELERAEKLFKQGAISQEEIRRLRIDLLRLRADFAADKGDLAAALKHREAAATEVEALVAAARKSMEQHTTTPGELRSYQAAMADARIETLKVAVRLQLANIVSIRDEDLREARALNERKAISVEDLHRAEQALLEAKARLAAER
jgi:RNA polymerase sigma factor (sigma-70 family)